MKIGVMSDLHIPYHDFRSVEKAVSIISDFCADTLILLGDVLDFYSISFWVRDPCRVDLRAELLEGVKFFDWLKSTLSDVRIIYIEGNHEERLFRYLAKKAPEIVKLGVVTPESILRLNDFGIKYVSNKLLCREFGSPFSIGNVYFLHGHEVPVGFTSVNVARNVFLRTLAHTVVGHFHRTQMYTHKSISGESYGCWSVGCLCRLNTEFSPINQWDRSVLLLSINNDNKIDYVGFVEV